MRELFIHLHKSELTDQQSESLDRYHNVNEVFPPNPQLTYRNYSQFLITRNPYARLISGFLDQFVYTKEPQLLDLSPLNDAAYESSERLSESQVSEVQAKVLAVNSFKEFVELLAIIPDEYRDIHFQSQSFVGKNLAHCDLGEGCLEYADVSQMGGHLSACYKKIFRSDQHASDTVTNFLESKRRRNSLYYAGESFPDAATMNIEVLDNLVCSPKPQDFYSEAEVVDAVYRIYRNDFERFDYSKDQIPFKSASTEVGDLPDEFNWQSYLELNPDLAQDEFYNERSAVRHYLEFGRYESIPRAYVIKAPTGFDWQVYTTMYPDLQAAGINDERSAIVHYLYFGIREGRKFQ